MDNKIMYTVSEVAELLNLTERAIRERIKQGTIDAEKNGKSWQIPSAQFRTTSEEPNETQSSLDILQSENEFLKRQITEKTGNYRNPTNQENVLIRSYSNSVRRLRNNNYSSKT